MSQYKVWVYAICKNESQFVDRWMDSMSEADQVVVLDTGSEDDTVERLRARGARVVVEQVVPWRFDVARNRSMELVDEDVDICVCTDLDEVFHPGWREKLERAWVPGAGRANYRYTWSFNADGSEGVTFWYEKIHARRSYQWVHPVHEVLEWTGEGREGPMVRAEGVQLDHHPDPKKSRAQYLPLLELSVKEAPEDDRNVHYLGREYLYRRRWDDCIRTLKRHLALPKATWRDERAASMRYIAKAYWNKGEKLEARDWYLRAITEAPYLREPYVDLAFMLYLQGEWEGVLYFTACALAITDRPASYICEAEAWGSLPYDLRAMAYYRTGAWEQAVEEVKKALEQEPGNERLQKNLVLMEQKLQKTF